MCPTGGHTAAAMNAARCLSLPLSLSLSLCPSLFVSLSLSLALPSQSLLFSLNSRCLSAATDLAAAALKVLKLRVVFGAAS